MAEKQIQEFQETMQGKRRSGAPMRRSQHPVTARSDLQTAGQDRPSPASRQKSISRDDSSDQRQASYDDGGVVSEGREVGFTPDNTNHKPLKRVFRKNDKRFQCRSNDVEI